MSHTPGPWHVIPDDSRPDVTAAIFGCIANVADTTAIDKATRAANAHLIAAAPDMRHALDIARSAIELLAACTTPRQKTDETLAIIDAAIAKAEGKQ